METNICTLTDSYKLLHDNMYPEGTEYVYSYFEARDGAEFDKTTFFGLQMLIKKHLLGKVVTTEKINRAEKLVARHFGNTKIFNRAKWDYIVEKHDGHLPVMICAVPEGTRVPNSNVLMTVCNTDPKCYWLTNHLETLLCHVWSASTVATLSRATKDMYKEFLRESCDAGENFAGLDFMLHDFGMRGVSSMESAGFEGAAHLINFLGTDTVIAMEYIEHYYGGVETGFSVPATEHSIMTAKARDGEEEVIEHLLDKYPTGILSVVSDSYDIYNCVENIYGKKFRDRILARDGKFVVRPDSGNPGIVVPKLLNLLYGAFGGTINKKGYRVLNPKVGLIWGDGIEMDGIRKVLDIVLGYGYSAENLVFGMGGGLLQKINRDTQCFAFKSSAQMRNGVWYDIFKDPIEGGKKSKKGRLVLLMKDGEFVTEPQTAENSNYNLLECVYCDGVSIKEYDFNEVIVNSHS